MAAVTCAKCHARVVKSKFCTECGFKHAPETLNPPPPKTQTRCCWSCGVILGNITKFCTECGAKQSRRNGPIQEDPAKVQARLAEQRKREEEERKRQLEAAKAAMEREKKAREELLKREKQRKELYAKKTQARTTSVAVLNQISHNKPQNRLSKVQTVDKGGAVLKNLRSMWDEKSNNEIESMQSNMFSANYDESVAKAKHLKPGDEGYGRAPEGSESAERVKKAELWVKQQIKMMIDTINYIGSPGPNGCYQTTFSELFVAYEKISDTCNGILKRAKKAKLLDFEGEILFQGGSDNVIIALTPKAADYNPNYS